MSILNRTTNFFDLYRHISGDSEVPAIFHFWACTALISAVIQDRIWVEKIKGEKLYPNLYIILVGPSGLGKGMAISQANRLVDASVRIPKYRGKITFARLIDRMGKPIVNENGIPSIADPRLWLVMDELKNDVGSGILVEDFIGFMTECYTASNYTLNTGTRTHGDVDLVRPVLNWFAGTTESWLYKVLTPDMVDTGFPARICFIFGDYAGKLKPRIRYPDDRDFIWEHLVARLYNIACQQGKCLMTQTAEAAIDKWYVSRKMPEDAALIPGWRREHDMLLKFAVINTLADGGPLVIRHMHVARSIAMVASMRKYGEKILTAATATKETKEVDVVGNWIKQKGQIKHSDLTRAMHKKGLNAWRVKLSIQDLRQKDLIEIGTTPTGGGVYLWKG